MEIPQLNQLMRELVELSCCPSCPFSSTAAAKCFAGLLNKLPAGTEMRLGAGASWNQLLIKSWKLSLYKKKLLII